MSLSPSTTTNVPRTSNVDETARNVSSSQVVNAYEQDGKQYLEVWLIDPTWNLNYWKANPAELTRKVERFVGKPAILTPYLHHPHEYDHIPERKDDPEGNVRKYNEIDERYRIGHIVKIKPLSNAAYAGIIEITHAGACNAFKQGNIPLYVSPAVYNLNMTGPQGEFTNFEPLHVAFVNEPAYGLKATVLNSCNGQQDTCLRNLGVAATGMGESCIQKALSNVHSFYVKSNASVGSELSTKEDSATPPTTDQVKEPVVPAAQSTDNKESKATKQKPETHTSKEPTKESTADNKKDNKEAQGKEEKEPAKAPTLDEIKALMKEQMAEFMKSYKEEQDAKAAKEAKRKLIETYVTLESANGNAEEREKRIESLMHIPDADLQVFLEQHYKIPGKSRTNAAKASKTSDFNRGMQQSTPNVATAALLLDQDTNDRIDRILSISKFVPNAKIVPTTATAGDTA